MTLRHFVGAGIVAFFVAFLLLFGSFMARAIDLTTDMGGFSAGQVTGLRDTFVNKQVISSTAIAIRLYSQTITPASVAANDCAEETFTVTGLATTDTVAINPVATGNATSAGQVRVSAADTLAVTYCNPTAGALVPGAGTMTIFAVR